MPRAARLLYCLIFIQLIFIQTPFVGVYIPANHAIRLTLFFMMYLTIK